MNVDIIKAFEGVTANTTSQKIWVGGYKKVALLFRRANHVAGSSAFSVKGGFGADAAVDPTMTTLSTLIDNVTNTNAQNLTRVSGKTLSADGDAMVWLDQATPVTHLEVTVTETTDGTHSAYIIGFC